MPYSYIPDGRQGKRARKAHPEGALRPVPGKEENPHARARGDVRPYLLTRFRDRKTDEMKSVSASMRDMLASDLKAYMKRNGFKKTEIPSRIDENYFAKIGGILCDGNESNVEIVEHNGRPHFLVREEINFWEDGPCSLSIGGARFIGTPAVKDAAELFLSFFLRNNPFTAFSDTVWSSLYMDVRNSYIDDGIVTGDDDERTEFLESNAENITTTLEEEIPCHGYMELLKMRNMGPGFDREAMLSALSSVQAGNETERELLDTLKKGVCYAFEKRWDCDDLDCDIYSYASVTVCPYDFFTVTLGDLDPFYVGNEIANYFYDGDCYYIMPNVSFILEGDGTMTDIYDRGGFSAFCCELSSVLNKFNDNATTERHDHTAA